ncbi:MAG: TetR/AcrR family transcriptional regulator [Chloroflexi bacterium]|nr:TetR/AcrR family transcriptional regulator [Chloroflexota bacterium]
MAARKESKQTRQTQILDAAMEVFVHLGFSKARMDDIAAEAGVSKGSLYWHFKSKDDIISAVLYRLFQGGLGELRQIKAMDIPADEKLQRVVQRLAIDVQAMQRWQPLMAEFYAVAMRHGSVQQYLRRYYREYIELLSAVIDEGRDAGIFHTDDAVQAAFTMTAAVEGTILLAALGLSDEGWGQQVENTLLHVMQGI